MCNGDDSSLAYLETGVLCILESQTRVSDDPMLTMIALFVVAMTW
jgi:hypothetical protein